MLLWHFAVLVHLLSVVFNRSPEVNFKRISASLMASCSKGYQIRDLIRVNVFVAFELRVLFQVRIWVKLTARGTNRTIIRIKMFLWNLLAYFIWFMSFLID